MCSTPSQPCATARMRSIQAGCGPWSNSAMCRFPMTASGLLKNPPILILDEATSALDAITEARVHAALAEVMKGRTTFVIAHRLATVRNANRILVFEAGRIIESGSFDELVRRGGHFAELARSQFMAGEPVKKRHARASSQAAGR